MEQKVYPVQFQKDLCGAWVVAVNMGYGHQRTAYPLRNLAPEGKVINANDYQGIPGTDRKIWEGTRKFYEFISRFSKVPLVGKTVFSIYDRFQKILSFYPKRELSKPNFSLRQIFNLIKNGWGRHLIKTLRLRSGQEPLPLISTFFIPAFMAEFLNYPGDIFCVVCDADISRPWASLTPSSTRIKYFAPNNRVVERLKLYGVKPENIFLTGYPLPLKNIGTEKLEILKEDLKHRLLNLDPNRRYYYQYESLIKEYLGEMPRISDHQLTLMFSVGGAGTQKEIGVQILKSLSKKVKEKQIKIILSAGIKKAVKEHFLKNIKKLGLEDNLGKNIEIIFAPDIESYFQKFNQTLRKTDILWTKPSELSFYTALGLPIIISPSVGSQEDFNREWLLGLGSATIQENPRYTNQWFFDLLDSGWFAEAAMQGFIEGEKLGTFNIQRIISKIEK